MVRLFLARLLDTLRSSVQRTLALGLLHQILLGLGLCIVKEWLVKIAQMGAWRARSYDGQDFHQLTSPLPLLECEIIIVQVLLLLLGSLEGFGLAACISKEKN